MRMHVLVFKACCWMYSGNIDSSGNDFKLQSEATIVIHVQVFKVVPSKHKMEYKQN